MAGDWIKMRIDLQSHPKVVRILSATKSDKFRVIGGLHAVWSVFDTHCEDGALFGYTPETLDHIIGWTGFSSALIGVGWLVDNDGVSLEIPEFSEHNGQSGKRRAEDQKRKRDSRKSPDSVRNSSANEADKKVTREEKRREDINTKQPSDDGFESVYQQYPKKVGKPAALKAWRSQKVNAEEAQLILRDIAKRKQSQEWLKDSGQFIPNPSTYINQRRWEDQPAQVVSIMRGVI